MVSSDEDHGRSSDEDHGRSRRSGVEDREVR
jgi:hypothetical protein